MHKFFILTAVIVIGIASACSGQNITAPRASTEATSDLVDAAFRGDASTVQALLAKGTDINEIGHTSAGNVTALIAAAARDHLDVVQILLVKGAAVDARVRPNISAIHAAAQAGHTQIVDALIKHGANINSQGGSRGATPLYFASDRGKLNTVKFLLANGADVNAADSAGGTALMIASQNNYLDVVRTLIAAKANVNAKANDGITALHASSIRGHREINQVLLAAGADTSQLTTFKPIRHYYPTGTGCDILGAAVIEAYAAHGWPIYGNGIDCTKLVR